MSYRFLSPYKGHCKKVQQYNADGDLVNVFESIKQAAKSIKRDISAISHHCKGHTKLCGGYKWKIVQKLPSIL